MDTSNNTLDILSLWHTITIRTLKELPYDLSTRQLAVMLSVYTTPPPHTIRSLSDTLRVSKPAICRAVDSLSMMELIKRKKDESDRRNVFIQRTITGSVYLSDLAEIISYEMDDITAPVTSKQLSTA